MKNNLKYLVAVIALVPFISFASDIVSITSVEINAANHGTAIVSGLSTYDASTTPAQTNVKMDGGAVKSSTGNSWTLMFTELSAGQHSVRASVGSVSASKSFSVPSGEGGLICSKENPWCGMPHSFEDLMKAQKPVVIEKPLGAMSELELTIKILQLKIQVLLLQLQLANL